MATTATAGKNDSNSYISIYLLFVFELSSVVCENEATLRKIMNEWRKNPQPEQVEYFKNVIKNLMAYVTSVEFEKSGYGVYFETMKQANHFLQPYYKNGEGKYDLNVEPLQKQARQLTEEEMVNFTGFVLTQIIKLEKKYDARIRKTLRNLYANHLLLTLHALLNLEHRIVVFLNNNNNNNNSVREGEEMESKEFFFFLDKGTLDDKGGLSWKKKAMIGGAALAGGTAFFLSGGLIAPALASVVGGTSTYAGALLASNTGASIVTSLFGLAGARASANRMIRRTKDLEEFFFVPLSNVNHCLNVTVVIGGFLQSLDVVTINEYWEESLNGVINAGLESDCTVLLYDRNEMMAYGTGIGDLVKDQAKSMAYKEAARTLLGSLFVAATTLPFALSTMLDLVDNKFAIARNRSISAGLELAKCLSDDESNNVVVVGNGKRPVSLVGFGFGALTCLVCCLELFRKNQFGCVENCVCLCTPHVTNVEELNQISCVLQGKFVNAYCENDYILTLMLRLSYKKNGLLLGIGPVLADADDHSLGKPSFLQNVSIPHGHLELGRSSELMNEALKLCFVKLME